MRDEYSKFFVICPLLSLGKPLYSGGRFIKPIAILHQTLGGALKTSHW